MNSIDLASEKDGSVVSKPRARRAKGAGVASILALFAVGAAISAGCAADGAVEFVDESGEPGTVEEAGALPAEIRRAVEAAFPGTVVDHLVYEREVLAETGQEIHRVKGVDSDTQEPVGACFDGHGELLADCGYELRAAEYELYRERHSAMDAELRAHLAEVAPDTEVPVSIWLKLFEPREPREALLADPALAEAAVARRDAELEAVRQRLLAALPAGLGERLWFAPGAPAAFGSFTADELRRIGASEPVASVSLKKPNEASATNWPAATSAVGTGYNGAGTRVCVLEAGQPSTPNSLTITGSYCTPGGAGDWHARLVAGVIRSSATPTGIAPGASIYTASWAGCDPNVAGAMDYCADQSVHVWNWSHTCDASDTRLFDYWAKQYPYPLVTAASGNSGSAVGCGTSCGTARAEVSCAMFNTLIVGAANDCGTDTRADDAIACFSRDNNPSDTRELPHLVASGQSIDADGWAAGASGTSFAAPMVAGAAAQLMQANTALKGWPEAARSILMATADENIDGGPLSLSDGVDDRDGTGEVSASRAINAGLPSAKMDGGNSGVQRGHDYGSLTSGGTPAGTMYSEVWRAWVPLGSTRPVRVVLSWDATATCTYSSSNSASCPTATTLDADLDLYVYRESDGALVAQSTTGPNSYEAVEFNGAPGQSYLIKVKAYSWTNSSTYYGVAWDTFGPI